MKQTSTKRNIAVLALLLLAIGAGYLYTNNYRTSNKGQDATTSSTTGQTADMTAVPVVTPAPIDTPPTTENDMMSNSVVTDNATVKPVATARKHKHKAALATEDDIAYANASDYGGNKPVPRPANVTINATRTDEQPKKTPVQNTKQKNAIRYYSSDKGSKGINIAPELGVSLNGLYRNNNANNLLTNGIRAGVMVNIGINDGFAVQPGIVYTMKGNEDKATTTQEGVQINTTHNIMLNYVELPVNIVYKFGDKRGNPRFMIGAGPYVSYLFSAQNKVEITTINAEQFTTSKHDYTINSTKGMNTVDFGVGGFIGCQLPKGFYAKASTEWGLRDIMQQPATGSAADRNYSYLLSVGYILGPKNKEY
jgi:hypothetical protein